MEFARTRARSRVRAAFIARPGLTGLATPVARALDWYSVARGGAGGAGGAIMTGAAGDTGSAEWRGPRVRRRPDGWAAWLNSLSSACRKGCAPWVARGGRSALGCLHNMTPSSLL